jgi:5-methylcytosine-specific restriction protein B
MAVIPISAILWRRINKATFDSLVGASRGQYHIGLAKPDGIEDFFDPLPRVDDGDVGGFRITVPIQPVDGANPVPATNLDVCYVGDDSARKDWRIPSQRPTTAYPLWRPGRGLIANARWPQDAQRCFIVLIRDITGGFHARWLSEAFFANLPQFLQNIMNGEEVGIHEVGATAAAGESLVEDILQRLRDHYNVLLYGPPATGKTHLMQEVIKSFSGLKIDTAEVNSGIVGGHANTLVGWVTFHQSYSYEEFLISLRPESGSDRLLNLVPVPGLLLELAEFARQPGNSSLLVIDEINRGNVSRIFGEFITLMEPAKRLAEDGSKTAETVEVRLPYLRPGEDAKVTVAENERTVTTPFSMPRRLYCLASMNSVDKSVAPLDAALRRRFNIVSLHPDLEGFAQKLGITLPAEGQPFILKDPVSEAGEVKQLAIVLLRVLNRYIC